MMHISYKWPNSQAKHLNQKLFSSTFIADINNANMFTYTEKKCQLPNNISI